MPDPSNPDFAFPGFTANRAAYVYAWRRDDEWLYVGCSGALARPFSHNIIGRVDDLRDTDFIHAWALGSFEEALAFEATLIALQKPKYNALPGARQCRFIECVGCGQRFKQTRWWQRFHDTPCRIRGRG